MSNLSPWQKSFQQAAFRGKPFFITSADSEIGRKTVVYEFATNDNAFSIDLGRKTRRFSFQAVVFNKQNTLARDELRKAFEWPGPGQLVHPWWGAIDVVITDLTVRETTDEGGITRFDIKATEVVNALQGPIATVPADKKLSAAADALLAQRAAFVAATSPLTAASTFVRTSVAGTVGSIVTEMRRIKGTIDSVTGAIDTVAQQITQLGNVASSIILTPQALASSITGLYASIFGSISRISSATQSSANLLKNLMTGGGAFGTTQTTPGVTPQRTIEANANNALVYLVRASVIGAAAATIPTIDYATLDEALGLRDALSDLVDDLQGNVDDDTYASLQDVRAAAAAYLENASISLPLVSSYTPLETTPALCIAYLLYGDATLDADIVARNLHIYNPMQVPGGVPLQVVSSV